MTNAGEQKHLIMEHNHSRMHLDRDAKMVYNSSAVICLFTQDILQPIRSEHTWKCLKSNSQSSYYNVINLHFTLSRINLYRMNSDPMWPPFKG